MGRRQWDVLAIESPLKSLWHDDEEVDELSRLEID